MDIKPIDPLQMWFRMPSIERKRILLAMTRQERDELQQRIEAFRAAALERWKQLCENPNDVE